MKKSIQIMIGSAALLCSFWVYGYNEDLRAIKPESRIGVISEAVVKEKLKTYGISNVTSIRKLDDHYEIKANVEGKEKTLEMHTLTGFLREPGASQHIQPVGKARELMIKPRLELQRPDRMNIPR